MATKEQKFVRVFDRQEIHLTACAVIKTAIINGIKLAVIEDLMGGINNAIIEPNQFWHRNYRHERALLKIYKNDLEKNLETESITCDGYPVQLLKIPMPFLGNNSFDGWGEIQFLIKEPKSVKLARHRSFDTRINQWVSETQPIQPKTDFVTHAYLALRFYHQNHLPPIPTDWHFEPVYISIKNKWFYKIGVLWIKENIIIRETELDRNSPEIPKHLK